MDGRWMDGWIDGWIDRQIDRNSMDGQINRKGMASWVRKGSQISENKFSNKYIFIYQYVNLANTT